jgi:uncharacterized secreted repeat protein (TIGR03808 family)
MLNRRALLAAAGASLVVPATAAPQWTKVATYDPDLMRGAMSPGDFGVSPGAVDDQSRAFARMLARAAEDDVPVFLPPGTYEVSNIVLPSRVRLSGVPGATRILYRGDGHLLLAEDARHVELVGLTIDGDNRWIADHAEALCVFRRVDHLVVDNCRIVGSAANGLTLEKVSGRIERTIVSGAASIGLYSVEAGRLAITGNAVTDCGDGGILVHRWRRGEDFTTVSGNRVERIAARSGGTGQYGNGINAFRADNVQISSNTIVDCAFSSIRANSAGNIRISGNTCMRSGETGIYSEFAFEGAVIDGNVVDGAANGISIVNFDQGGRLAVCSGNLVRNLSRTGPYPADAPGFGVGITVEADTSLTGNVVENAPLYGIKVGWGPYMRNVAVTGNIVRQAGTGIAVTVVEGAGAAVISDNLMDACPGGGVVGFRWSEPATGDLAKVPESGYPHLTVERNRLG